MYARGLASRCPSFATAGSAESSSLDVIHRCHERLPGQVASLIAVHSSIQVIAVTFVSRAVSAMQAGTRVDATRLHYRCSRCQHAQVRSIGRVNDAVQHRAVGCRAFVERTDVVQAVMQC